MHTHIHSKYIPLPQLIEPNWFRTDWRRGSAKSCQIIVIIENEKNGQSVGTSNDFFLQNVGKRAQRRIVCACAHCAEFILTGCSIFAHNCVNKSCVVINGFYNSIMILNHSTCVCVYIFSITHWWNWINEPKCIELVWFFAFFKRSTALNKIE